MAHTTHSVGYSRLGGKLVRNRSESGRDSIRRSRSYSKRGKPSATLNVVDVDKIEPVVDEFCRVHLTASAYQKVMEQSTASEKTNK